MIQYYYKKYLTDLASGRKPNRPPLIYTLRRRFFNKHDPEIEIKIGKNFLAMNLSHRLPIYYYQFPNYDRALPRICKQLDEQENNLTVIDIGANIGDTASLITDIVKGDFLCIEGDTKYLPLLKKNTQQIQKDSSIQIFEGYCSNTDIENISIVNFDGTAKIINNASVKRNKSQNIKIKSLDNIIEEYPAFKNANLLKIDTDGSEINIINSGKIFITEAKPLIYFEYTPELYLQNNQDPKEMWKILKEDGYDKALFYDNFGNPIEIVPIANHEEINNLISKIDKKNISYYDVLVCNKKTHYSILESELKLKK